MNNPDDFRFKYLKNVNFPFGRKVIGHCIFNLRNNVVFTFTKGPFPDNKASYENDCTQFKEPF